MPNAFVFALLLTFMTGFGSYIWLEASLFEIIKSWYHGFFDLISFAMQIVLIIITGFSIALSPAVKNGIDSLSKYIKTPAQVYFFVVFIGMILSACSNTNMQEKNKKTITTRAVLLLFFGLMKTENPPSLTLKVMIIEISL